MHTRRRDSRYAGGSGITSISLKALAARKTEFPRVRMYRTLRRRRGNDPTERVEIPSSCLKIQARKVATRGRF